jgi:hypothetical protein
MQRRSSQVEGIGGQPGDTASDSRTNQRYNLRPRASLRRPERLRASGLSTPQLEPREKHAPQRRKRQMVLTVGVPGMSLHDHAHVYCFDT